MKNSIIPDHNKVCSVPSCDTRDKSIKEINQLILLLSCSNLEKVRTKVKEMVEHV